MDKALLLVIIVICITLIVACAIKRRKDLIVDFILRACTGTAGIYLLDLFLDSKSFHVSVGVNGFTALTNGFLGLPGFILLYGLAVYYFYR